MLAGHGQRRIGRLLGAFAVAALPLAAFAQSQPPLSVIDWLDTQMDGTGSTGAAAPVAEPPVATSARAPDVSVQSLEEGGPRDIGLVPPRITGLPRDIWTGSDPERLTRMISALPDPALPAALSLLYTLLLAEAGAPGGKSSAGDALALTRAKKLVRLGALDPALALMEQTGVTITSDHFDLWMQISLLTGTEDRACTVLNDAPQLTKDYAARIFCGARAGNWDNAALTLGSAKALNLLPQETLNLLEHFLDPEALDAGVPLVLPRAMDPLSFRLFETIGEPVPTGNLPLQYAVADLRDLSGWKAQIEAAERLSRWGALPDNRLLGLYTDRRPAASGGVWDRVAALQRFETALKTGSVEAISKTLPPAWEGMTEARLEVTFAALFAEALKGPALEGRAARIAADMLLLSPAYETAANTMAEDRLPVWIARGEVPPRRPSGMTEGAVYDAFAAAPVRDDLTELVSQQRLGEAILKTLSQLHSGSDGNAPALTEALVGLRALGLEDAARRAALQALLLDR